MMEGWKAGVKTLGFQLANSLSCKNLMPLHKDAFMHKTSTLPEIQKSFKLENTLNQKPFHTRSSKVLALAYSSPFCFHWREWRGGGMQKILQPGFGIFCN